MTKLCYNAHVFGKKEIFFIDFRRTKILSHPSTLTFPPPSPHLEIPGHATVTFTFTDMRLTFNTIQSELLCNLIT